MLHRNLGRPVDGRVIGHQSAGAGKRVREGVEGRAAPLRLVLSRDDYHPSWRALPHHGRILSSRRVADVEAHITGTVWKIEVAVGDQVDEGDTVAILESMKMEMPVEAEDSGEVAEIRVEEGQSVSEGEVLVVLE
jgi:acetyl-CoA carboxylase biotin carboxyl carrier protein